MTYFAVREGHTTGIFDSWDSARPAVEGYATAEFETFSDLQSAEIYMTGYAMDTMHIYTDGSCIGKSPNRTAAWAFVHGDAQRAGAVPGAQTSNRAELLAIHEALLYAQSKNQITVVHSDSKLCVQTLTEYCQKWKANGWKTVSGKPVKNQDIVKPAVELYDSMPQATIQWVSRDSNEQADAAAKAMAMQLA